MVRATGYRPAEAAHLESAFGPVRAQKLGPDPIRTVSSALRRPSQSSFLSRRPAKAPVAGLQPSQAKDAVIREEAVFERLDPEHVLAIDVECVAMVEGIVGPQQVIADQGGAGSQFVNRKTNRCEFDLGKIKRPQAN